MTKEDTDDAPSTAASVEELIREAQAGAKAQHNPIDFAAKYGIKWYGDNDTTPLVEWLVEQTLPRRGTAILAGQWGTYKSFMALDLAASLMIGSSFAGRKVARQGGTLFIAAEGSNTIRSRLMGVLQDKVAPAVESHGIAIDPKNPPFL
jgi:hypothetical protein